MEAPSIKWQKLNRKHFSKKQNQPNKQKPKKTLKTKFFLAPNIHTLLPTKSQKLWCFKIFMCYEIPEVNIDILHMDVWKLTFK